MLITTENIKKILETNWQSTEQKSLSQKISDGPIDLSTWNAVSVMVIVGDQLFFIKRSNLMPNFKGHLAFVGGYKKSQDLTPIDTARREFTEETSISADNLDFLGYLPVISTVASRTILPLVFKLEIDPKIFISTIKTNGEWTCAFLFDLKKIIHSPNWVHGEGISKNKTRYVLFHSLDKAHMLSTLRNPEDELLWGATAAIVWIFGQMLSSNHSLIHV